MLRTVAVYWGYIMSFALYTVGFLIFIGGLAYGAFLLGIPYEWIAAGAITLIGLAILTGVKATRQKDASS